MRSIHAVFICKACFYYMRTALVASAQTTVFYYTELLVCGAFIMHSLYYA